MTWKERIHKELDNGFYKSDIESLAGIPPNSLSSALSGKRELSKRAMLKLEKWLDSDKPDPLTFKGIKVKYVNGSKPESEVTNVDEVTPPDEPDLPKVPVIDKAKPNKGSELKNEAILKEISDIVDQKMPSGITTSIEKRIWNSEQQSRISKLQSQLK